MEPYVWEATAGKLDKLGLVRDHPAVRPLFRIRQGYSTSSSWNRNLSSEEASDNKWWQWWSEEGLIAWEVPSHQIGQLPEEERLRLGLPAPERDVTYHVDPTLAFVSSGRMVFPWSALVGADGSLTSPSYASARGCTTKGEQEHHGEKDSFCWWEQAGRIAWELPSEKVENLSGVNRALLGLPEPSASYRYLVEPRRAFIVGRRLVFPVNSVCGYLEAGR